MPEIKNQFTGGKMNKDLDERLVPSGEYRDAMNVQVSTSESSDVGTVQNILGNNVPPGMANIDLSNGAICVGSISDEKNDAFYWLVNEPYSTIQPDVTYGRDIILQSQNGVVKYVFVDIKGPIISVDIINTTTGQVIINSPVGFNSLSNGTSFILGYNVSGVFEPFVDSLGNSYQYTIANLDASTLSFIDENLINPPWESVYFPDSPASGIIQIFPLNPGVLNLPQKLITGINIVDDMLFWTDGVTEPKKINIPRSIQGTNQNGLEHTNIINPEQNRFGSDKIEEEHITVIRKSPKSVLNVDKKTLGLPSNGTTDPVATNVLIDPSTTLNYVVGDEFPIYVYPNYSTNIPLQLGDNLLFNSTSSTSSPNDDPSFSVVLLDQINDGSTDITVVVAGATVVVSGTAGTYEIWMVQLQSINDSLPQSLWKWESKINKDDIFKNIFPRFSYRYKYQDGEYSTFAPFTKVVFQPGNFKYNVKEAFNTGMENQITSVRLSNYDANLPEDVESVDLLYKESNSPIVYTIETLRKNYITSGNTFEVKTNQIKAALPENQTLRVYDNVPRNALAQDITGSRIVYGNYLQNYTLENEPVVQASLKQREHCDLTINSDFDGLPSIKSIRNYSLGVSFLDKYGRQSPVFTSKQSDLELPIEKSSNANQISAKLLGYVPDWASYYKIYVKETSNEYYNLAMDRIYDARDGNIWLSFPSSDRNKIDEETFLILKKGVEGSSPVSESNRYKVLAIANEAPEFIKTRALRLGLASETNMDNTNGTNNTYFQSLNDLPLPDSNKFAINASNWRSVGLELSEFKDLSVRFSILIGTARQTSRSYNVVNFEEDSNYYKFILDKKISSDEDWLETSPGSGDLNATIGVTIYRNEVKNTPQFDGRFFVKVVQDLNIDINIIQQAVQSSVTEMQPISQLSYRYISDGSDPDAATNVSGLSGVSGALDTEAEWDAVFGSSGTNGSGWFIDNCYYTGFYAPGADTQYLESTGIWEGYNTTDNYPNTKTPGYNKGIYTDNNGQTWMHLTFGYLQSTIGTASVYQDQATELHRDQTLVQSGSTQVQTAYPCLLAPTGYQDPDCGSSEAQAFWEGIYDWDDNNNHRSTFWQLGTSNNPFHQDELANHTALITPGTKFRFPDDPNEVLYTIGSTEVYYHLNWFNTEAMQFHYVNEIPSQVNYNTPLAGVTTEVFTHMRKLGSSSNRRITYRVPIDKDPTDPSVSPNFNPIGVDSNGATIANLTTSSTIQFVESAWDEYSDDQVVSEDPAIWETEPRDDEGLDIYYEADSTFPTKINNDTNYTFAPIGSTITSSSSLIILNNPTTVVGWNNNVVEVDQSMQLLGTKPVQITFHRPDGSCVTASLEFLQGGNALPSGGGSYGVTASINPNVASTEINLSWFNCYSFQNGVESDRVRDDFNQVRIDKGAKVSATLDEPYKEEKRKYGLIHSGLYNSTSSVNNLNQFIQAEKITKDINPIYGSIQKLHTRDTDLIALCEDKVLRILANKDAVFNADGNTQLTATANVLGQTIPFVGEYGISKNPESFASEAYRAYFTDKTRGAVIRLSKDGLTPISNHGMKDWFKDNLKDKNFLLGSYDDRKDEYNITLANDLLLANLQQDFVEYPGIEYDNDNDRWLKVTATFKEDIRGWVSFKSFVPESAISCANEYYTFKGGIPWKHHDENVDRNTFYGIYNNSTLSLVLNDAPETIKSFDTLNYEGSQSKVDQFTTKTTDDYGNAIPAITDGEYYNLQAKDGWYVERIKTDKQKGFVNEFIKKEGKWFNYIKGAEIQYITDTTDPSNPLAKLLIDKDGNSNWED
mgnify:CR=1 FL=1